MNILIILTALAVMATIATLAIKLSESRDEARCSHRARNEALKRIDNLQAERDDLVQTLSQYESYTVELGDRNDTLSQALFEAENKVRQHEAIERSMRDVNGPIMQSAGAIAAATAIKETLEKFEVDAERARHDKKRMPRLADRIERTLLELWGEALTIDKA